MTKIYAVPMTLYVEALDKDRAAAKAELDAFQATQNLQNSAPRMIRHNTTLVRSGKPKRAESIPEECYDKATLIKVFGEKRAIRLLNHIANHC